MKWIRVRFLQISRCVWHDTSRVRNWRPGTEGQAFPRTIYKADQKYAYKKHVEKTNGEKEPAEEHDRETGRYLTIYLRNKQRGTFR